MYFIEINSGDEYRARIENDKIKKEGDGRPEERDLEDENKTDEEQKLFFKDIYDRAMDITKEIIREMRKYSEKSGKNGKYKTKYQGMGNNIIAFCAERGQGKTSAMQSFSAILRKDNKRKEDKRECEGIYFEVLDSIDPSSLDKGESIVRVLISRIFDNIINQLDNIEKYDYDEYDFQKKKRDIFTLFQECYENIDYLRKEKEIGQNSLEKLAQLGSSARLKSNLHDLIKKYMQIACKSSGDKNKTYECLVVQIDDADLAVNNVFQICEDIRNYFSIPNVLVLMAANFTQLRNAIHQWYLKQYEHMINLQSKEFADECSLMAARYMEKMIPAGHRIVLPDIDTIIKEEFQSIKIRYNCKPVLFDSSYKLCHDIQEQLLKALYQKTGIILLKEKGKLHPFLPHTLRELTHFVKMLSEMKTINHKKVFQVIPDYYDKNEVENLKSNISVIKGYFLEYWCHSHIKRYNYQILMDKIGGLNQQLPLLYKSIIDYFFLDIGEDLEKVTCYDIFNTLVANLETIEEEEPGKIFEFQEALRLYGTIMLNEWFLKITKNNSGEKENEDNSKDRNKEQISSLVKGVGKIIDASELYKSGVIKGYKVLKFIFNGSKLTGYLGDKEDSDKDRIWFKNYCNSDISFDKNNENIVIQEGDKLVWNKNFQEAEFDFFKVLLSIILKYWQSAGEEEGGLQNGQDSSEDNDINQAGDYEIISLRLIMIRNIITNYDVHKRIKEKINTICRNLEYNQNLSSVSYIYTQLYEVIDNIINEDARYLDQHATLKDIFKDNNEIEDKMLQVLILSNEENYKQYVKDYKKYLKKTIDDKIKLLDNDKSNVQDDEYLVKLECSQFTGIVNVNIIDPQLNMLKEIDRKLHNETEKLFNNVKELLNGDKELEDENNSQDINNKIMEYVQQSKEVLNTIKKEFDNIAGRQEEI